MSVVPYRAGIARYSVKRTCIVVSTVEIPNECRPFVGRDCFFRICRANPGPGHMDDSRFRCEARKNSAQTCRQKSREAVLLLE